MIAPLEINRICHKYASHNRHLLGVQKSMNLLWLLKACLDYSGHVAEAGVYQGGATAAMAEVLQVNRDSWHPLAQKKVYAFDTFRGMPLSGEHDTHKVGEFSETSLESCKKYWGENALLPYVIPVPGILEYTTRLDWLDKKAYCFVHIDLDQYESTLTAIDYFYPRCTGIMLFDDWAWHDCPGVERAIRERFHSNRINVLSAHQAFVICGTNP